MEQADFVKIYGFDPPREFLKLEKMVSNMNDNSQISKENMKTIENNLEICTNLIFCDYVYVPTAICLLSKYPYAKQMEKCLEIIYNMMFDSNENNDEFLKLIIHLLKEIPIPVENTRLLFNIPLYSKPLIINGPIIKDLPIVNYSTCTIFKYFSIENIIFIHYLMTIEQKLLFIADEYYQLTEIMETFISFLYPLT